MTLVSIPLYTLGLSPSRSYLLDAFNGLTEQLFGYPTFGYWKWFNTEGAGETFDKNASHQCF